MSASGIITLGLLQTPSLVITVGLFNGDAVSVTVGCTVAMAIYQPGADASDVYQSGADAMQTGCC